MFELIPQFFFVVVGSQAYIQILTSCLLGDPGVEALQKSVVCEGNPTFDELSVLNFRGP